MMNIIKEFDSDTIALFDLSLLGQEVYLCVKKNIFLFLPFYKLGHYDDIKGMVYTYNKGYLILDGVSTYNVRITPYKQKTIDYDSTINYEMNFGEFKIKKEIALDDLGFRTTGLVALSIKVKYSSLHVAYNFTSPDCTPTSYLEVIQDKEITNFLTNSDLNFLHNLTYLNQ